MFGKLKDKLKDALSVFSKKTEEQADVKEDIVEIPLTIEHTASKPEKLAPNQAESPTHKQSEMVEKPTVEKPIHPIKLIPQDVNKQVQVPPKPTQALYHSKDHPSSHKQESNTKEHSTNVKIVVPVKESTTPVMEKKSEEQVDEKQEKKGFFAKIFSKKEEPKDESKIQPIVEVKSEIRTEFNTTGQESKNQIKHLIKEHKHAREDITEIKAQPPIQKHDTAPAKTTSEIRSDIKSEVKSEVKSEIKIPEEDHANKSFFGKIKEAITTKTISSEKFEELFWELELALLENNVSVEVIERIKDDLKTELVDKPLPRDVSKKIEETLTKTLRDILTYKTTPLLTQIKESSKKPFVIALFGINGAGKTTSIAKLTYYLQKHDLSIVLAACDTFRAAAIQQLEEHASRLNVKIIKHDYGSDAAAVAFDAIKYAEKSRIDVVLIDTAGRLHSNTNLMAELEKIIRVTKPDLKIFVGESITGNDCIEQARQFNKLVEMDGAILTKADVDEKGGAPLSISYSIKKPILFLGMGQEYKDLQPFDVELILKNLGF